ncbi:hypothetical protein R3P38DRAFT_3339971, partial [Favolaschia claudopus]
MQLSPTFSDPRRRYSRPQWETAQGASRRKFKPSVGDCSRRFRTSIRVARHSRQRLHFNFNASSRASRLQDLDPRRNICTSRLQATSQDSTARQGSNLKTSTASTGTARLARQGIASTSSFVP